MTTNNIFHKSLSTNPPLSAFTRRVHSVGLPPKIDTEHSVQTNKFYTNLLIGSQTQPIWTHPYGLRLCKDDNTIYGLGVSYPYEQQKFTNSNSVTVQDTDFMSFVFSSLDFHSKDEMYLSLLNLKHMSVQTQLKKSPSQFIWFPMVQGMGFVTAIYYNLLPKLQSDIGFRYIKSLPTMRSNIQKYEILLQNNHKWIMYVSTPSESTMNLRLRNQNTIVGDKLAKGTMFQIVADSSKQLDNAAGCYPIDCDLSGSIYDANATLQFNYKLKGKSNNCSTLIYALPHHLESLTEETLGKKIDSVVDSNVFGQMTGFITASLDFNLKITKTANFNFENQLTLTEKTSLSLEKIELISKVVSLEVQNNIDEEIQGIDDIKIIGKIFSKWAWILYLSHYILKNRLLVSTILAKLKKAMNKFIHDTLNEKFMYDTNWGGIIQSSQFTDNYNYNNHHSEYGYFIITSAILGRIDLEVTNGNWLSENKAWVEDIIRDYEGISDSDPYFPAFRAFDWFHGHSWSTGLVECPNGREYYSSAEDVNSVYAVKLWGLATGNKQLIDISNIQLVLLKKSINQYILTDNQNSVIPRSFNQHKVCGMLSDLKMTYKVIRGLPMSQLQLHTQHILPITPASSQIRSLEFSKEEWDELLSEIISTDTDGIENNTIMLNNAPLHPQYTYDYFANISFDKPNLDPSQSLTWSLAYSAAFI